MDPEPDTSIKLPEPVVLIKEREADELAPAFGDTRRVSRGDLARLLAGWLHARLVESFPNIASGAWIRQLGAMTDVSTVFFRQSERAVLFAMIVQNTLFSTKPIVICHFLFHQDLGPEGGSQRESEGEKQALLLAREVRNWARQLGAVEVTGFEEHCDLPWSRLNGRFIMEKQERILMKVA